MSDAFGVRRPLLLRSCARLGPGPRASLGSCTELPSCSPLGRRPRGALALLRRLEPPEAERRAAPARSRAAVLAARRAVGTVAPLLARLEALGYAVRTVGLAELARAVGRREQLQPWDDR